MTCDTVRETMCEYLDDLLAGEEKAAFLRHLASCDYCSQEAEELRQAIDWVRHAEAVSPPPGLRRAVLAELEREKTKKRFFAGGFGQAVAAAAVFVLLVAGNLLPAPQMRTASDPAPMNVMEQEQFLPAEDTVNNFGILEESETENGFTKVEVRTLQEGVPAENGAERTGFTLPDNFRLLMNLMLIPLFAMLSFLAVKKRRERTP